MNKLIIKHVENTLNVSISDVQAENAKKAIGSLVAGDESKFVIQGKDFYSGKPRSLNISASQIYEPIKEYADKVIGVCKIVLSKLGDQTLSELIKSGLYLAGGGCALYGLEEYLSKELDVQVTAIKEPILSTVIGAGKLTEDKKLLTKLKLKSE